MNTSESLDHSVQRQDTEVLRARIVADVVTNEELMQWFLRGVTSVLDLEEKQRVIVRQEDNELYLKVLTNEVYQMRTRIGFLEEKFEKLEETIFKSKPMVRVRKTLRRCRQAIWDGLGALDRKVQAIYGEESKMSESYIAGFNDLRQYAGILAGNDVPSSSESSLSQSVIHSVGRIVSEDTGSDTDLIVAKKLKKAGKGVLTRKPVAVDSVKIRKTLSEQALKKEGPRFDMSMGKSHPRPKHSGVLPGVKRGFNLATNTYDTRVHEPAPTETETNIALVRAGMSPVREKGIAAYDWEDRYKPEDQLELERALNWSLRDEEFPPLGVSDKVILAEKPLIADVEGGGEEERKAEPAWVKENKETNRQLEVAEVARKIIERAVKREEGRRTLKKEKGKKTNT